MKLMKHVSMIINTFGWPLNQIVNKYKNRHFLNGPAITTSLDGKHKAKSNSNDKNFHNEYSIRK